MNEPASQQRPVIDLDEFERRLRRPAAPRGGDDPLAELARLVGGESDPFKAVFDDERVPESYMPPHSQERHAEDRNAEDRSTFHGDPDWDRVEPAPMPTSPRLRGDFAAIEAGLRGSLPPEPSFAPEARGFDFEPASAGHDPQTQQGETWLANQAKGETWLADAANDETWRANTEAAAPAVAPPPEGRSRRPLYIMATIIAAGIAGIGASFALKGGVTAPRQVAMIKAAAGPTKVQPDNPGGLDVPNQDASILDKTPQPAPAGVVDHTEQPIDLTQMPVSAPRAVTLGNDNVSAGQGAAKVALPLTPAQAQMPAAAPGDATPMSITALIEPKKVKTISVRPDGTLLPNDPPLQMADTSAPAPVAPHKPAVPAIPTAKAATPKTTARLATTPQQHAGVEAGEGAAAPHRPAAPLVAKPKPIVPRPVAGKPLNLASAQEGDGAAAAPESANVSAGGGFAVQLAAPGSEQEARETSARLLKKFASELDGRHPSIHKAAVGDKSVYRVRVGGLSREEATALCEKLHAGGGNCFVAKN